MSIGLLIFRLWISLSMIYGHGWHKLERLMEGRTDGFPDPLDLTPEISLTLATSAEVGACICVGIGLATRLTALPVAFTMLVAAFWVHAGDPFRQRELALLYMMAFLAVSFTGPGHFSCDRLLSRSSSAT